MRNNMENKEQKIESPKRKNKDFIDKKKKWLIYSTLLVILIIIISLYFLTDHYGEKQKNDEANVIEYMEHLGKDFYENYYYPQLSELKKNNMIEEIPTFLENFTNTGIPVSLNKVIEQHFETEKAINKALGKYNCNFSETKFVIYPQSPYEKTSYEIEPYIVCQNLNIEKNEEE